MVTSEGRAVMMPVSSLASELAAAASLKPVFLSVSPAVKHHGRWQMDEPAVGQSEPVTHTHTHIMTMEQGFSLNMLRRLAADPDYRDVSLPAVDRVRLLSRMGSRVELSEDVPPRRYLRSGVEMEHMASVYLQEGRWRTPTCLYNKFITLFVEKLPAHRDYQQCSLPEKQLIMKKLQEVAFPRKDELKKRLQEKYSLEHSEYLRAQAATAEAEGRGLQLQQLSLLGDDRGRGQEENRGRGLQLVRPSSLGDDRGRGPEEERGRGLQLERLSLLDQDRGRGLRMEDRGRGLLMEEDRGRGLMVEEDRGRGLMMEEERRRVVALQRLQIETEQFRFFEDQLQRQELANRRAEEAGLKPDNKALEVTDRSSLSQQPIRGSVPSQGAEPIRNRPPAPVSQSNGSLAAVHSRVEGLRQVLVPRDLTSRFLLLAESNTARGLETCGILCGRLMQNEFLLTHVVVPKQSSGPDFCDMENVEELFRFQDQKNLLTLGWIHTHPTQTAFLSSVDLHTHCSYQRMLPEAIAIVCAPKHNDCGVFRLSSSGMSEVSLCRLKGFHPHSKDPPLFSVCKHVSLREAKVVLLDLR
ncbi:LOW QUALITY PROTEIN: AMSH-like protease [Trematomus bernacchii]|uniref:LOW QUALITY PROTEIN: AMSH-like protease n=1 Tax=Trematomus bernacchii TaxID=40690 RepID=UPI00146E8E54|nr:LOW QUALITY PROTEIN: AMSH-like protease [Trematomus bernacchii]